MKKKLEENEYFLVVTDKAGNEKVRKAIHYDIYLVALQSMKWRMMGLKDDPTYILNSDIEFFIRDKLLPKRIEYEKKVKEDFLERVKKLKPGQAIVFDETAKLSPKHEQKQNKVKHKIN